MEDFILNVLKGKNDTPPLIVSEALSNNFENSQNIEWHRHEQGYEAVFYKDNLEYIAIFSSNGKLLTYKIYLTAEHLPELIKLFLQSKGEIMNVVLINKGNTIEYETIVRDSNLVRYQIQLTDLGKVICEIEL